MSAELIKSSTGLGFLMQMGRELNEAAQVIGIMVLTIYLVCEYLCDGAWRPRLAIGHDFSEEGDSRNACGDETRKSQ